MSFCNITNEMALFRKVKSLFKREPLSYFLHYLQVHTELAPRGIKKYLAN